MEVETWLPADFLFPVCRVLGSSSQAVSQQDWAICALGVAGISTSGGILQIRHWKHLFSVV
jgi:hypothetical protein